MVGGGGGGRSTQVEKCEGQWKHKEETVGQGLSERH